MKSFTGQVNSFGVPTGTAAAAAPSGTTATAAPPPDLDVLQTEVNNLSADLYQAGVDLQATKFYLEQFQNNLANANKPMNVLTEEFNNIGVSEFRLPIDVFEIDKA
jgi:hypothetical protein